MSSPIRMIRTNDLPLTSPLTYPSLGSRQFLQNVQVRLYKFVRISRLVKYLQISREIALVILIHVAVK